MKKKYIINTLLLVFSLTSLACMAKDRVAPYAKVSSRNFVLDSRGISTPNLEIELPNNWIYKKIKGPDFYVHWLSPPEDRGSLGIYVGYHPDFREPKDLPSLKRQVGNKDVSFYPLKMYMGATTLFEAVVEGFFLGSTEEGLKLHIMIDEKKSGFAEEAIEYLKTLRAIKRDG
jgi:hypothetical protein